MISIYAISNKLSHLSKHGLRHCSKPGTSDSIKFKSNFRRISCAWWTSRRKMACSLTPWIPKVAGCDPNAITSLSYETVNFQGSIVCSPSVTVSQCTFKTKHQIQIFHISHTASTNNIPTTFQPKLISYYVFLGTKK
jgi:hypothetical protein